jgi:hypothetical protein
LWQHLLLLLLQPLLLLLVVRQAVKGMAAEVALGRLELLLLLLVLVVSRLQHTLAVCWSTWRGKGHRGRSVLACSLVMHSRRYCSRAGGEWQLESF